MNMSFEHLVYDKRGKVTSLTLNRPHLLNALHYDAVVELEEASKVVAEDPEITTITINGAGRAFSTGIDLKDLSAGKIDMSYHPPWEAALRRFETMDKVVICLIHGYAIGGGLQLALACDIRVCTPAAELGVPAIHEGLLPGLGTLRLARYIGMGRAKQMILSGDTVTGEAALAIGLVDHLVGEESMLEEFEDLVRKYLANNSQGCRLSKRMLAHAFDLDFDQFLSRYMDLQTNAMASDDFREAMAAYRERRTPVWN